MHNICADVKHFQIALKFCNQPLLNQSCGLHEKIYKKHKLKLDVCPVFHDEVHRHEMFITNLNPDETTHAKLDGNVADMNLDVGLIPCNVTDMLPSHTNVSSVLRGVMPLLL